MRQGRVWHGRPTAHPVRAHTARPDLPGAVVRLRPETDLRGHPDGPLPAQLRRAVPGAAPPGAKRADPDPGPSGPGGPVSPAAPRLRANPDRPGSPHQLAARPR